MAVAIPLESTGFWANRRARRHPDTLPIRRSLRVLTASAKPIDIADKKEAVRIRSVRQGWQSNAWEYRDTIGEIRYAARFSAHCVGRMRVYPAAYPTGDVGEDPISLAEIEGVPPNIVASAKAAMSDLGSGRLAMTQIMEAIAENFFVAGEGNIVGIKDPETGEDRFSIRSIDEVIVKDGTYQVRELPSLGAGDQASFYELTENDYLARLWTPHPRFSALADSALRALSEQCEELLILSRMIRAAGRSRLAGAGILFMPDEISIQSQTEDNEDPEADDFMAQLTTAMVEPIADEGVASAVVPLVVQGPGDMIQHVQHVTFDRPIDKVMAEQRQELLARIAIGLDLPSEVLTGKADLNHWTAWNVDDNTFRHHIEPLVIACVDALTVGYLRSAMLGDGCDPNWVNRIVLWYDPTDLVVHPDRSADALLLHERLVISDAALREATGYSDSDEPTNDELLLRMLRNERSFPDDVVISLFHKYAPTLDIIATPTEPGVKPDGTVSPAQSALAPPTAEGPPAPGAPVSVTPPAESSPSPSAVTSSAGPQTADRLSRKLTDIDRDLRTRLQVLTNAAVRQVLSKAGARLRTKITAGKDETMKVAINQRPNHLVASIIGEQAVGALGLTASQLVNNDWSDVEQQYSTWTKAAGKAAVATACAIAGVSTNSAQAEVLQARLDSGRIAGWTALSASLDAITAGLLYSPNPSDTGEEWGDIDPNALMPAGAIRGTLAIAGGAALTSVAEAMTSRTSTNSSPMGQIGTGDAVSTMLANAGSSQDSYEWVHGPAIREFEPHVELDGVTFAAFDDEVLANSGPWPEVSYLTPGDHEGCTCDFVILWTIPDSSGPDGQTDEPGDDS